MDTSRGPRYLTLMEKVKLKAAVDSQNFQNSKKKLVKFCQNLQFLVKIIKIMVLTFDWPQTARVTAYLVKILFLKGSRNLINTNF